MNGGRATEEAERDQAVDLTRLAAGIRRRWRWVVWPTLAALVASSAFVLLASPRYTGVAKVLLEDQESYFTRPDKASGLDPAATIDPEAVQSQAEAVASSDLARKAIDRLGLATDPEFSADRDGKIDRRVVDKFLSRLTVFPVPRSRVLQIEFVSRDPELAARGANTVAEVYLESQTEAKANAARTAGAWLSRKIDELRAKVADADAKVEAFRAQSGLLGGANGQTVPAQQLSELNAQLSNARSAEAAATAKADLLRRLEREGRLDEAPEFDRRRVDAALRRTARDAHGPDRGGVPNAVAVASAHEGAERAARGTGRRDSRCGGEKRPRSGERRAARGRSGRVLVRGALAAIEDCGDRQCRRCAVARS